MAYGLSDIVQQRRMIDESTGSDAFKRVSIGKLDALVGSAETAGCRRSRLLGYFGEAVSGRNCGNCDNCLSPPQVRDGKVTAQKLLSCAYRTGQRFGAMHLIDVLVGRMTERVTQFGHDKLSVFGIGAELNEKQWRRRSGSRGDGPSAGRQRSLWRVEADRERARRAEGRDRGDAARGAEAPHSRQPGQVTARRSGAAPGRIGQPPMPACRRRCGHGAPRSRASAACRPMSCCTIPPSTASPPRARDAQRTAQHPGIGDKKLEHYGDELIAW
jgi:ATP-dependent DNA helicase RecQ